MRQRAIGQERLGRSILRLALPVLAEESLMILVGYTDWWLTGHFLDGASPQAAMALMSYLMWLLPSLFSALAIGATAVVARRVGEGRIADASFTANQALGLGLGFAVVAWGLARWFAEPFPRWMQLQPEAARLATTYFQTVSWVIPLIMAEQVIASSLRGAGDTVTGFVAKAIVVAVNLVVSSGLVTGWGPFPQWGWDGLAVGTAVGHGLGGGLLLLVFLVGRSGLRFRLAHLRPDAGVVRLLLRIGLPGGGDMAAILACQFLFVALVNRMGDLSAAAHGLAVQIEALAYMPGSAFQVAAATLAGQSLGAKRLERARQSAVLCLLGGGGVMSAGGLLFAYQGETLTGWFLGDPASPTAVTASGLLQIVACSMPALALCQIGAGTLRGAGETRWPFVITLIGFGLVRLPLALVLGWSPTTAESGWLSAVPLLGLGVVGAWLAMVADLWLRGLLIGWRLLRGDWQHLELSES